MALARLVTYRAHDDVLRSQSARLIRKVTYVTKVTM